MTDPSDPGTLPVAHTSHSIGGLFCLVCMLSIVFLVHEYDRHQAEKRIAEMRKHTLGLPLRLEDLPFDVEIRISAVPIRVRESATTPITYCYLAAMPATDRAGYFLRALYVREMLPRNFKIVKAKNGHPEIQEIPITEPDPSDPRMM